MSAGSLSVEGMKSRIEGRFENGAIRYYVDGEGFATIKEARWHQRLNDSLAADPTCGGLISIGSDGKEYA